MQHWLVGLQAALVVTGASLSAGARDGDEAEMKRKTATTRDGGTTEVVAHRGASAYAPENTLAAFQLAAEMGAEWFELDAQLSGDGVPVVIHDGTLDRTTDMEGPVQGLTVAQIREADAGSKKGPEFSGERIPLLSEALAFAWRRIGVYLEIKSAAGGELGGRSPLEAVQEVLAVYPNLDQLEEGPFRTACEREAALVQAIVRDIRATDSAADVLIQSFSPIACAMARLEAPGVPVALLGGGCEEDVAWEAFVAVGRAMEVDSFSVDMRSLSEARIRALHDEGFGVAVYTINDDAVMAQLVAWGADRIITDRPDACLKVTRGE